MKPTTPVSLSHIICRHDLFYLPFIFRSVKPKIQKYLAAIFSNLFYLAFREIYLSNLLQFSPVSVPTSGAVTRKGLTTPLTRGVARCCYLCAAAVYIVLLGSPTGSINLVSYLREILTLLCFITLSSSRKTNASSRHSKKDYRRHCRGGSST